MSNDHSSLSLGPMTIGHAPDEVLDHRTNHHHNHQHYDLYLSVLRPGLPPPSDWGVSKPSIQKGKQAENFMTSSELPETIAAIRAKRQQRPHAALGGKLPISRNRRQ
ncbi:hypothetical protein [Streptomyces sp. NPDC059479]|uniref:hypothetical protein n=1 Tax=Streptomyces sp. NPDC059479 TaxID=3346848 RepID=UPI0036B3D3A0